MMNFLLPKLEIYSSRSPSSSRIEDSYTYIKRRPSSSSRQRSITLRCKSPLHVREARIVETEPDWEAVEPIYEYREPRTRRRRPSSPAQERCHHHCQARPPSPSPPSPPAPDPVKEKLDAMAAHNAALVAEIKDLKARMQAEEAVRRPQSSVPRCTNEWSCKCGRCGPQAGLRREVEPRRGDYDGYGNGSRFYFDRARNVNVEVRRPRWADEEDERSGSSTSRPKRVRWDG